jgi:3-hydroxyisobutyrate dehydrogenase-like beta-hydroxyacid dehydrogenase
MIQRSQDELIAGDCIGFIGLGNQGAPMAAALAAAGFSLHVWARRPASYGALAGVPHVVCDSVADLAQRCRAVGVCVLDDAGVEEILFERALVRHLAPGALIAVHSTGSPTAAAEFAERARESEVYVLDATVSGGREAARQKQLAVLVGGDERAFQRGMAMFSSYGATIRYMGASGSAQLAKLFNTLVCNANMRNIADALMAADALGLDKTALLAVLQSGTASSWAAGFYGNLAMTVDPAHLDRVVSKDLRLLTDILRSNGVPPSPSEAAAAGSIAALARVQAMLRR